MGLMMNAADIDREEEKPVKKEEENKPKKSSKENKCKEHKIKSRRFKPLKTLRTVLTAGLLIARTCFLFNIVGLSAVAAPGIAVIGAVALGVAHFSNKGLDSINRHVIKIVKKNPNPIAVGMITVAEQGLLLSGLGVAGVGASTLIGVASGAVSGIKKFLGPKKEHEKCR